MKKYGLGCMKSPYDSRDYQFSDLVPAASFWNRLPKSYEPQIDLKVFDQGSSSMCCACAVAMSRYITESIDSGNTRLFSPGFIYGNRASSVVVDGVYEGEGMFLKDAMKQLIASGVCYYDTIPTFNSYENMRSAYNEKKEEADKEAYPFRVSSYYAVKSEKEIKKAIMASGSVLASFLVTSGWYDTESDGMIPSYGNIEGGHAVLIIGWKVIDGKQYWIILNSWGSSWGNNGLGYIETTEMMIEAYCILDEVHELQLKDETSEINKEV